jgi:uncharacterized membrane protein
MGPVQILVLSFDEPHLTGEAIDELNRLRENDVIRVIDMLAVSKTSDGSIEALRWSDLSIPEAEDLGATIGALLGLGFDGDAGMDAGAVAGWEAGSDGHLIGDDELWNLADSIAEGSIAVIALLEHHWATPLREAIARAGGYPVLAEWVHPLDLVEIGLLAAEVQ